MLVWLCWQLPHVCAAWVCVVCFAKVFLYRHVELQGKRPTHVWAGRGCPLSVVGRPLFGHGVFMGYMLLRAAGWLDILLPLRVAAHCAHFASLYPAVTILNTPRGLATSLNYGGLGALAFLDLATPLGGLGGVCLSISLQCLSGFWFAPALESSMVALAFYVAFNDALWGLIQRELRPVPLPLETTARALLEFSFSNYELLKRCLLTNKPQSRYFIFLSVFTVITELVRIDNPMSYEIIFGAPMLADPTNILKEAEAAGMLSYAAPPLRGRSPLETLTSAHLCLTHMVIAFPVLRAIQAIPSSCVISRVLLPFYSIASTLFQVFTQRTFGVNTIALGMTEADFLDWIDAEVMVWQEPATFARYVSHLKQCSNKRRPVDAQVAHCWRACKTVLSREWDASPPTEEEQRIFLAHLPMLGEMCCFDAVLLFVLEVIIVHPLRGEVFFSSGVAAAMMPPGILSNPRLKAPFLAVRNYGGAWPASTQDLNASFVAACATGLPFAKDRYCLSEWELGSSLS
jgi:hypothetical protein